jgi:hypothetical protein
MHLYYYEKRPDASHGRMRHSAREKGEKGEKRKGSLMKLPSEPKQVFCFHQLGILGCHKNTRFSQKQTQTPPTCRAAGGRGLPQGEGKEGQGAG